MDALVIALSALVAGLATMAGIGLSLLILGCLAALLVFLFSGRFAPAATQVPAIAAMSAAVWLCWRAVRKEIRILDSVLKEGAPAEVAPAGGERLSREAKLRAIKVDLVVLALCAAVILQAAWLLRRILGPRSHPEGPEIQVTASNSSYSAARSNPRLS